MDTKATILDKALELFSSRGYEAVGIQEIVQKSGIGKPTLYYYFGNKEGLLNELVSNTVSPLTGELEQAALYENDLPMTIRRITAAFFNFARKNPHVYRLLLSMSSAPPESTSYKMIFPYVQQHFTMLEDLFKKASSDHGNMKGRHARYAISLIGTINTYITVYLHDQIELTDELAFGVIHQFMHGIFS